MLQVFIEKSFINKQIFYRCFISLLGAALLSSCSMSSGGNMPASQMEARIRHSPRTLIDEDTEQVSQKYHNYLLGRLSLVKEDFESARYYLQQSSNLHKGDASSLHATLADLYLKDQKLEDASREIEKALENDPENISYKLLFGGILASLGKKEESISVYNEIISGNEFVPDAYMLLSSIYSESGELEKAAVVLKKLLKKEPKSSIAHFYLGRIYEDLKQYDQAERVLKKAYDMEVGNEGIALQYIRVLLAQDKFERVRSVCKDLLKKNPNNSLIQRILGELALGEKKLDVALGHLRASQSESNSQNDIRFKIALIEIERQNYPNAMRELNLILVSDPKNSVARYYLASIYAGSGRNTEALVELQKIDNEQSMFEKARTFMAFLHQQDNNLDEAISAVREVTSFNPKNLKAFTYLVLLLKRAEKFEEAKDLLEASLEKDPDNVRHRFSYALVLHSLAEEDEAIVQMEKVIEKSPQNSDALNFVAYGLAERNIDLKRAVELSKRAIALRAHDGYYLDTLGYIYFLQKDYKKSEEILSQAVELSDGDIVIAEHYCDTLLELKDYEKLKKAYEDMLRTAEKTKSLTREEDEALERSKEKFSHSLKFTDNSSQEK